MKNTKKFAAMMAALTLTACSVAPMFSFAAISASDINEGNYTTTLTQDGQDAYESEGNGDFDTWWSGLTTEKRTEYSEDKDFTDDLDQTDPGQTDPGQTPTADSKNFTLVLDPDDKSLPAGATIQSVKAYQVLTLDVKADGSYTVDGWGDGIKVEDLLSDIQAETSNLFKVDGVNIFAGIEYAQSNDKSFSDMAVALGKIANNADAAKLFARYVMNNLEGSGTDATYADGKATFTDPLDNGYYIFTCEAKGPDEADYTSKSLGMLTVVDGTTTTAIGSEGKAKVGLPTVMKKVMEDDHADIASFNSQTTNALEKAVNEDNAALGEEENGVAGTDRYNDGADWAIGQTKSFKLYGTLPDNYAEYDEYYYEFCDTLAKQFDAPTGTITIMVGDIKLTATAPASGNEWTVTAPAGVDIDDAGITVTVVDGAVDGVPTNSHAINVAFDNLKAITNNDDAVVDKDTVITVEYETQLNSSAVVGKEGQENEVSLKYSNNPNQDGNGRNTPGETPKDKVIVFTYALEFDKTFFEGGSDLTVDEIKDETYTDLVFTLTDEETGELVKVKKADEGDNEYDYYIVDQNEALSDEIINEMKLTLVDGSGNKIDKTADESWADSVNSSYRLRIKIKGLDSGTYTIDEDDQYYDGDFKYETIDGEEVEIITGVKYRQDWDGEHKMTEPTAHEKDIYQKITYKFGEAGQKSHEHTASGTIKNTKTSSLPSTGGIGTTIFYLGGGAMVAVAGVFLITKKRMGKQEN